MQYRESLGYRLFYYGNILFMVTLCVVILYPYLNVLSVGLNDNGTVPGRGLMIMPRAPTLMNFRALFVDANITRSAVVTLARVVLGVMLTLSVEYCAAYALSKKYLGGRKALLFFFIVPMFITGGLIPSYILYSRMHLLNNFLVYILPSACSFFDILIMRAFIGTIPESLEESARIDGASEFQILRKIYFPLSAPIIATVALWSAVYHWNDWTSTLYFVPTNVNMSTLQFELQRILREANRAYMVIQSAIMHGQMPRQAPRTSEGIRSAQIILTTLPIVLIYPFLQKYFIKGILLGSIKE